MQPIQVMYYNHLLECKATFFQQISSYNAILLSSTTSIIRVKKQPKNSENVEFDRLPVQMNSKSHTIG
jgi:hypothetical protein